MSKKNGLLESPKPLQIKTCNSFSIAYSYDVTNNIGKQVGKRKFLLSLMLYSGGEDEIRCYLSHWGVPEALHDLEIASLSYDLARGAL